MCGIIGLISKDSKDKIVGCNNLIAHRGPDDNGYLCHDNLSLAHRRLSIQDLSANGHQPMISLDDNYVIIFNGEIYNHWDIRKKLENKYTFNSNSDTETLLYGFIEYGKEILNQLNGIFAFAILDKKKNELFIARDQFGVKPLYYYCDNNQFWFSSEIKSILNTDFDHTISNEALVNYLTFLYSPADKTPFEKVYKLLPGHCIMLHINDFQNFKIEQYYEIPFDNQRIDKSESDLIEELESLLINAVQRQMLSDVPVGFFLSGGLDSSCIVAIAKKLYPEKKFNCYTIKTNDGNKAEEGFVDDLYYARIVAKHLDVNLIEVDADINIVDEFDQMIYHLDEPQADPAPLNVLYICKKAKLDGQTVLLGGTAGDDLFSGYRRHQSLKIENTIGYIPLFLRKTIRYCIQKLPVKIPLFRRLIKLSNNLHLSQIDRIVGYFSWFDKEKLNLLFSDDLKPIVLKYQPLQILKNYINKIPNEKDILNQMLFLEMNFFLTDHNLNYTDKMSMATGVEVRVPFLDKELVEFSTKIPTNLKLKGIKTKYILKKVMEKYLPNEVIYRSKSGFGAPVRKWIIKDLDNVINILLSKEKLDNRGIFDYKAVHKLINDNKAGKIDASYTIWALLAIESWMKQFNNNNETNHTFL
jgi:asparagine synthase (glutamine-hydrolysing)